MTSKVGEQLRPMRGGQSARDRRGRLEASGGTDSSVFSVVTRRWLEDLEKQVDRRELELNGMLLALVGAVVRIEVKLNGLLLALVVVVVAEIYRAVTH